MDTIGQLHTSVSVDLAQADRALAKHARDLQRIQVGQKAAGRSGLEAGSGIARGLSLAEKEALATTYGFDGLLSSTRRLKAEAATLQQQFTTTTKAARETSIGVAAIKGLGIVAAVAAAGQLGEELERADGAAGDLGKTLHGVASLDIKKTFSGIGGLIGEADRATGGWLGRLTGVKWFVDGLKRDWDEILQAIDGAGLRAERAQAQISEALSGARLTTGGQDDRDALRAQASLLRARLAGALGDPLTGKQKIAAQDQLTKVNEALRALNRPLPVQLPMNMRLAESEARAAGDTKRLGGILKAEVIRLKTAPDRLNLSDEQRVDLNQLIASKRAEIRSLGRKPSEATARIRERAEPIVPLALQERLAIAQADVRGVKDDVRALRDIEGFLVERVKTEKDINRRVDQLRELGDTRERIAALTKPATARVAQLAALDGRSWWGVLREQAEIAIRQAEELKRSADKFKQAALDRLDRKQSGLDTARELDDARKAYRLSLRINGKQFSTDALRRVQDADLARQRFLLERSTVTPAGSGTFNVNGPIIINGVRDVDDLMEQIRQRTKSAAPRTRGRYDKLAGIN